MIFMTVKQILRRLCGLKLAYDPSSEHRLDVGKYWKCWKENHRVRCCDRGCEYLWKYVAHPTSLKFLYLLFAPHHLAWGSQIYQASDSPDYRRGNTANVATSGCTILLWLAQKAYYKYNNVHAYRTAFVYHIAPQELSSKTCTGCFGSPTSQPATPPLSARSHRG